MNEQTHIRRINEEEEGGSDFLSYIPLILWQRKWFVIVPFVLLSLAGIAAALLFPTTYRSTAVLLVESQELPRELVNSPVTNIVGQRIAKIQQQVLSRGDLIDLIQQINLYEDERRTKPMSVLVEDMRQSTTIAPVEADAQQSGQPTTIAFTMSFDYKDAAKAQLVMQSYVDRFLEMDASQLAEQATNAVDFLTAQAGDLQRQIVAIEGQITGIKSQNGRALASAGLPTVATPGSYDAQIAALMRENVLVRQQAQKNAKDPMVSAAEAQLAAARAVYADNHPDVLIAEQRLQEVRKLAAVNRADNSNADAAAAIIASNNTQIAALGQARSRELAQVSSATAIQSAAPVIMEQVAQLENRAAVLRAQYQEVSTRLLAARNAARMESEEKGERLAVADPPNFPDDPVSPNRPLFVAGGIAAGLGLGFVLALLVEFLLRPIRGVSQLERIIGAPPLVVVPTLKATKTKSGFFSRFFGGSGGDDTRRGSAA